MSLCNALDAVEDSMRSSQERGGAKHVIREKKENIHVLEHSPAGPLLAFVAYIMPSQKLIQSNKSVS